MLNSRKRKTYHSIAARGLIPCFVAALLAGCDFFDKPPSQDMLMQYFTTHYEYFVELQEMCEAFPTIKSIDGDGTAFLASYKPDQRQQSVWTEEELAAKSKMLRLLHRLGMEEVMCHYAPDDSSRPKGARIVVKSLLTSSGKNGVLAIDYEAGCLPSPPGKKDKPDLDTTVYALSKPCWFLHRSW